MAPRKTTKTTANSAVKEAEKKTSAAKKEPVKKPAAPKRTTASSQPKTSVFVEFNNNQVDAQALSERAVADYKAKGNTDAVKSVKLYITPEQNAAYYVINDKAIEDNKIEL